MADEVEIRIGLPLPLDVVTSVGNAICAMYPSARIKTDTRHVGDMVLVIDDEQRLPRVGKQKLAKSKVTTDDPKMEGLLAQWDADGMGISFPEYTRLRLAEICVSILENDAAPNYLEWPVRAPDGRRYVVAACRSMGQTPHALRMKAEQERDAALAEVERLRAELAEVRDG